MFKKMVLGAVAAVTLAAFAPAAAEDAPRLFDPSNRLTRPDLSGLPRLRFLTTLDFPPFNFADNSGRAAGFNIDIARAICRELEIEAKCELQAMPWDELDVTLDGMRGEAIIAGHRITSALRAERDLSAPYFRFPARFTARTDFDIERPDMSSIALRRRVAVVEGSAHAAMLEAWFPDARAVPMRDMEAAYQALRDGDVSLLFGDGVAIAFWLASTASDACCRFVSGPFMSDHFLSPGMAIVMRQNSAGLSQAMDHALSKIEENGVYQEIYDRYFPLSPFSDIAPASTPPAGIGQEGEAQRPDETG